jgi:hypothetical protein
LKELGLLNGDLDVSGNDLRIIEGAPMVAQQIQVLLRSFLGEWEFDLDYGPPWFTRILGVKPVNLNDAENALKDEILGVDYVKEIASLSMDFDRTTRKWSLTGFVKTDFGDVTLEGVFP